MTIKWGDPIECNGVRPDWLRGRQPLSVDTGLDCGWLDYGPDELNSVEDWSWSHSDGAPCIRRCRLPADHSAYVALARGFHPWSGGDSAPDDWDGGTVLVQDAFGEHNQSSYPPRELSEPRIQNWSGVEGRARIIGYHKGIEVEGSAPVLGVFIKRMTEAEVRDLHSRVSRSMGSSGFKDSKWADCTVATLRELGLVESRAERFTRETGHAVTEAVEAALNWKDTHA